VVDTSEINAFSVPGGHIYVYRGLIERTANLSELAGVLGHEIAHVAERHAIDQWSRMERTRTGLAALFGIILRRPPPPDTAARPSGKPTARRSECWRSAGSSPSCSVP
jgi:beta-barrel assembly-enhancing protease